MPLPDADLHPVATGPAKRIVDEHADEQPLKLFAGWFCPFVQRVWITLEEKKIPYQYIEVNPYHKGEQLMSINPRGLVPTLQVGPGRSLYESTVVCEYLEDHYPEHEPHILPPKQQGKAGDDDADYQRARARIWADYVTSRVIPAFHRFLQFQPESGQDERAAAEQLDKLRGEYRDTLLTFARELVKGGGPGPFFGGEDLGLVDIVLAPWAVRTWVLDEFKGGLAIPEPGSKEERDDQEAWARWRTWLDAVTNRDSVKNTTSEREHYLPIYKRYADNTAQSELAKATRAGRGVP
ncbi:putative glutathione S-transferase [Microdochium trichocladiopsis]|uniref:Glutathione S-transferase n=1 Tax=Microdochium trichocladiopsis TaxID=1682393 RepID=A0A9P8Y156_9PEZI|nr:putative glutathione S-transferase [Microdochium trichocladiopsis]KAH7026146.1 putative glutathione S-transferase [Microdochium trichocladiopsis]